MSRIYKLHGVLLTALYFFLQAVLQALEHFYRPYKADTLEQHTGRAKSWPRKERAFWSTLCMSRIYKLHGVLLTALYFFLQAVLQALEHFYRPYKADTLEQHTGRAKSWPRREAQARTKSNRKHLAVKCLFPRPSRAPLGTGVCALLPPPPQRRAQPACALA